MVSLTARAGAEALVVEVDGPARMCASVSTSSGAMWTNCDDVQHAVHPSHGTSDAGTSWRFTLDGRAPERAFCAVTSAVSQAMHGSHASRALQISIVASC
jgi:hypothetical protein